MIALFCCPRWIKFKDILQYFNIHYFTHKLLIINTLQV